MIVVVWILSIVIRFALSRQREYLADAGSVELTKNPDAMISALRKIEGRGEIPGANSAVMEMCIDNPREGFSNIFDTHPSVDARVAALVKFAGGHDPGPLALEAPQETEATSEPPRGPWAPRRRRSIGASGGTVGAGTRHARSRTGRAVGQARQRGTAMELLRGLFNYSGRSGPAEYVVVLFAGLC